MATSLEAWSVATFRRGAISRSLAMRRLSSSVIDLSSGPSGPFKLTLPGRIAAILSRHHQVTKVFLRCQDGGCDHPPGRRTAGPEELTSRTQTGRVAPEDCCPGAPTDRYLRYRAYGLSSQALATGRHTE